MEPCSTSTRNMFATISLSFLLVVTLHTAVLTALECTAPFKCMAPEECGHADKSVPLFPCSTGRRAYRVCCPKAEETTPTTGNPLLPPAIGIMQYTARAGDSTTVSPITEKVEDLKMRDSYKLLPKLTVCGRNEMDKIYNDTFWRHKVIGGKVADEGMYPWMALLFSTGKEGGKTVSRPFCGGSLISKRYVLTAAHCVSSDKPPVKFVRLGEHDYRITNCTTQNIGCPKNIRVEEVISHEDFDLTSVRNDIALLRLSRDVSLTKNLRIRTVCLPFDYNVNTTEKSRFVVAGWGKTGHYEDLGSYMLLHAKLQATGACPTCPESTTSLPSCPLSPTKQLCIETSSANGPCQGDSGGPLAVQIEENHMIQVGIVSFVPGNCGQRGIPAVYTRVDAYLTWILDKIKP